MEIVSYILFPTKISKDATVSVEAGDECYINIEKGRSKTVQLTLTEAQKLAEIISSIKQSGGSDE